MLQTRLRAMVREDGRLRVCDDRTLDPGETLLIGREGDVGIGVDPVDRKVSRSALSVTLAEGRWEITATNRNRVFVHPWGQSPGEVKGDLVLAWPRVALRVGGSDNLEHWVLLDDSAQRLSRASTSVSGTTVTEKADQPRPLTLPQEQAVRCLFADLLAWPPIFPAQAKPLKQVATVLGVGREAIQRRLEEVRKKATAVGLTRQTSLNDPEYLYVLVRAGYLQPSDHDLDPVVADHTA